MTPDEAQQLENRISLLEQKTNFFIYPDRYVFERPITGGTKGLKLKGLATMGYVIACATAGTPFPSGWTVANSVTGRAVVTHNLGTTNYIVIVTGHNVGGFPTFASINGARGANSFTVDCTANGGLNNADFEFILIQK